MHFTVNPKSTVPLSEQIAEGLRFAIACGRLAARDRLPGVRRLAQDLLVNPNTVAKVYRDLEREGVLDTRPGSGAFVAEDAARLCRRSSRKVVQAAAVALVNKGLAVGLAPADIEAVVRNCLEEKEEMNHAEL